MMRIADDGKSLLMLDFEGMVGWLLLSRERETAVSTSRLCVCVHLSGGRYSNLKQFASWLHVAKDEKEAKYSLVTPVTTERVAVYLPADLIDWLITRGIFTSTEFILPAAAGFARFTKAWEDNFGQLTVGARSFRPPSTTTSKSASKHEDSKDQDSKHKDGKDQEDTSLFFSEDDSARLEILGVLASDDFRRAVGHAIAWMPDHHKQFIEWHDQRPALIKERAPGFTRSSAPFRSARIGGSAVFEADTYNACTLDASHTCLLRRANERSGVRAGLVVFVSGDAPLRLMESAFFARLHKQQTSEHLVAAASGFYYKQQFGIAYEVCRRGTLESFLVAPFDEIQTLGWFVDILHGLSFLHESKISHNNICLGSLYVDIQDDGNDIIRIGGFERATSSSALDEASAGTQGAVITLHTKAFIADVLDVKSRCAFFWAALCLCVCLSVWVLISVCLGDHDRRCRMVRLASEEQVVAAFQRSQAATVRAICKHNDAESAEKSLLLRLAEKQSIHGSTRSSGDHAPSGTLTSVLDVFRGLRADRQALERTLGSTSSGKRTGKHMTPAWFDDKLTMTLRIARALADVHARSSTALHQRVHRDVAARNVLVDDQGRFVMAALDGDQAIRRCGTVDSKVPTELWAAPEAVVSGIFTPQSDVWSFGVCVWEILNECERIPFSGTAWDSKTLDALRQQCQARSGPLWLGSSLPADCPRKLRDLLFQCWHFDPKDRPVMRAIVTQVWHACARWPRACGGLTYVFPCDPTAAGANGECLDVCAGRVRRGPSDSAARVPKCPDQP